MNLAKLTGEYRKEMEFKNYSPNTIDLYVSVTWSFLKDFSQNFSHPKRIPISIIKDWLKQCNSVSSLKIRIGAIKKFYQYVIKQPLKFKYVEYPRKEYRLPVILDQTEIKALFDTCMNLKHKCIMALMYSCGLRVGEVISLKVDDIDSKRMVILVRKGKGNKDRFVPLDNILLTILEEYLKQYNPTEYLFIGQFLPYYSERSIAEFLKTYAEKAGIKKRIYPHLLRHNCFSDMLSSGIDLRMIQTIAGHKSIKTTCLYTHLSTDIISKTKTPLQNIYK